MRNEAYINHRNGGLGLLERFTHYGLHFPRKTAVGFILIVALCAFEIFNFDTTRYALRNLLGDVRFVGLQWAGILAIAFCAIDFAGLMRIFTRDRGQDEPKEVWYLMGAWLLGATMNAVMTWWAVSLTLLQHEFGNEVLSREELLKIVPIFVAVLVWLTRILFIGSFTVAGEHFFTFTGEPQPEYAPSVNRPTSPQPAKRPVTSARSASPRRASAARPPQPKQQTLVSYPPTTNDVPGFLNDYEREGAYQEEQRQTRPQPASRSAKRGPSPAPKPKKSSDPGPRRGHSRIKQQPPRPNGVRRVQPGLGPSKRQGH